MKIRNTDLISLLFTLLIVFSASLFATISSSKELPRTQFPNDNRSKSTPTLNANSDTDQAKSESGQKAFMAQVKSTLQSNLENSLKEFLRPDKVVLSCDAVELFQRVATQTVNNASASEYLKNAKDETATKQFVFDVRETFNKFLKAQIEGGEKLRSGKVLITAESFNATAQKFCPVIPIC